MNILVTVNFNYLDKLFTMLNSLQINNIGQSLDVYVVANDVKEEDLSVFPNLDHVKLYLIHYKDAMLDQAPTTKRYPSIIYYRLIAANYLPKNLERVLYLDPDIIVLKDLSELYNMDFNGQYFIGSSNVKNVLRKFNESKNNAPKDSPYLNTGVLLINLNELRKFNQSEKIYHYILKRKNFFTLPDQDILQGLYGDKVKLIDNLKYNLSDRTILRYNLSHVVDKIDMDWVIKNCYIIHYFGRNKPWKENYKGILKVFYLQYKIK